MKVSFLFVRIGWLGRSKAVSEIKNLATMFISQRSRLLPFEIASSFHLRHPMLLQREKFAFLPEESFQKNLFPGSLILELELPPWYQFRDPLTIACSNILPASPGEIKFILIFISPNIVMTKGRKIFSTPPTSKYPALHKYMYLRAQVQRKNPKYCTFFGLQHTWDQNMYQEKKNYLW